MPLTPRGDLNVKAGGVRFPGSEDFDALRERMKSKRRFFPRGPAVKSLPSTSGGRDSFPDWRTKIPHAGILSSQKMLKNKNKQFKKKKGERESLLSSIEGGQKLFFRF